MPALGGRHQLKLAVSEPSPRPETDEVEDLAFVLESIDFMMRLKSLTPESKRELAELRSRLEAYEPGQPWR